MKKRAFTLIELLVVISIIAVLMSIMMPALSKVRMKGKQVICSNGIKNMAYSTILYLADNDQYFPTKDIGADGKYNTADDSYWDDKVFEYANDYEIFKCPITSSYFRQSIKNIASNLTTVEKWKHAETYRFNAWLEGWGGLASNRPWPDSHGSTIEPKPLSVSKVKNTASVVMFSDGSGVGENLSGVRRFSYFYNGSLRYMPDIMPAHEIKLKAGGATINFHNIPECSGGTTLGFADGHCENIPKFDYTVDTVNDKTPPKEGIKINPTGKDIR